MTVLTWLVAGGLAGWGASHYMGNKEFAAIAFNVAIAVLGAAFTGWIVAPIVGVEPGFGLFALLVSAFGAVAVLFCVNAVQQTLAR